MPPKPPSNSLPPGSAPTFTPVGQHAGKPDMVLSRSVTLIGSRDNARLQLISSTVSRAHALLVNTQNGAYICDLASREHTYVDGEEVREADLAAGTLVKIGRFTFQFNAPMTVAKRVPAPAATLEFRKKSHPLTSRFTFIGRREGADIALPKDESVSTSHAIIFESDGKRFIRDLGSRNGTFINDRMIQKQAELNLGDTLRIGTTEFKYTAVEAVETIDEMEDHVGTAPLAIDALGIEEAAEPEAVEAPEPVAEVDADEFEPLPVDMEIEEPSADELTPVQLDLEEPKTHEEPQPEPAQPIAEEPEPLVIEPLPAEPAEVDNSALSLEPAAKTADSTDIVDEILGLSADEKPPAEDLSLASPVAEVPTSDEAPAEEIAPLELGEPELEELHLDEPLAEPAPIEPLVAHDEHVEPAGQELELLDLSLAESTPAETTEQSEADEVFLVEEKIGSEEHDDTGVATLDHETLAADVRDDTAFEMEAIGAEEAEGQDTTDLGLSPRLAEPVAQAAPPPIAPVEEELELPELKFDDAFEDVPHVEAPAPIAEQPAIPELKLDQSIAPPPHVEEHVEEEAVFEPLVELTQPEIHEAEEVHDELDLSDSAFEMLEAPPAPAPQAAAPVEPEVIGHTEPTPESALDLDLEPSREEVAAAPVELTDSNFGRAVEDFSAESTGPIVEEVAPDFEYAAEAPPARHEPEPITVDEAPATGMGESLDDILADELMSAPKMSAPLAEPIAPLQPEAETVRSAVPDLALQPIAEAPKAPEPQPVAEVPPVAPPPQAQPARPAPPQAPGFDPFAWGANQAHFLGGMPLPLKELPPPPPTFGRVRVSFEEPVTPPPVIPAARKPVQPPAPPIEPEPAPEPLDEEIVEDLSLDDLASEHLVADEDGTVEDLAIDDLVAEDVDDLVEGEAIAEPAAPGELNLEDLALENLAEESLNGDGHEDDLEDVSDLVQEEEPAAPIAEAPRAPVKPPVAPRTFPTPPPASKRLRAQTARGTIPPFEGESATESNVTTGFDGLAMPPVRETDVFSQMPAFGEAIYTGEETEQPAAANSKPQRRGPRATKPEPWDAPLPEDPAAAAAPRTRPAGARSTPPAQASPVAKPAAKKRRWFGLRGLLLMMLLAMGVTVGAIWMLMPNRWQISAGLRFNNFGSMNLFDQRSLETSQKTLLASEDVHRRARDLATAAHVSAGFLGNPTQLSSIVSNVHLSETQLGELVVPINSTNAVADRERARALLTALYEADASMAKEAQQLRSQIEGITATKSRNTQKLSDLKSQIESLSKTAEALQARTRAVAAAEAELATIETAYNAAVAKTAGVKADLARLKQESAAAVATNAATSQPADTQVATMQAELTTLNQQIQKAQAANAEKAKLARTSLDTAMDAFQKQIAEAQKATKDHPELSAYIGAAEKLQDSTRELTDAMIKRQQEQYARLNDLKTHLNGQMEARRTDAWKTDPELKKYAENKEFKTRQYNTAVGQGLKKETEEIKAELDLLDKMVKARQTLIGDDTAMADAIDQVQKLIDATRFGLEEDRRKTEKMLDEMHKSFTASQPAVEKLPAEQKKLAMDMEKKLTAVNEARKQFTEASDAANAAGDEQMQTMQASASALLTKISDRKKEVAATLARNNSEEETRARQSGIEQKTAELATATKASADVEKTYLAARKAVADAKTLLAEATSAQTRLAKSKEDLDTTTKELAQVTAQLEMKTNVASKAVSPVKPTDGDVRVEQLPNNRPMYALIAVGLLAAVFTSLIFVSHGREGASEEIYTEGPVIEEVTPFDHNENNGNHLAELDPEPAHVEETEERVAV